MTLPLCPKCSGSKTARSRTSRFSRCAKNSSLAAITPAPSRLSARSTRSVAEKSTPWVR